MRKYFLADPNDAEYILHKLQDGNNSDFSLESDDDDIWEPPEKIQNHQVETDIIPPVDAKVDEQELNETDAVDEDSVTDVIDNEQSFAGVHHDYMNMRITEKQNIKCRRQVMQPTEILRDGAPELNEVSKPKSPLLYFKEYITDEICENLATNTNIYALQSSITKFKPSNRQEIQTLIVLHLIMGSLKYPRVRLYWDSALSVNAFIENMFREIFPATKQFAHCQ